MKLNATSTVELGGSERTLVFNMNTMSTIEKEFDANLMQEGEEFFSSLDFTKMIILIWAMLYKETPRPTIETVGEWLGDVHLEKISETIGEMLSMDSDTADKSNKSKSNKPASDPMKG